ncbi:MAG TPA: sigma-70 family RNA polymerase sigma factor [Candidatus Limnocylindrales bacterium]|nr:sigma-70 family RNA polymerase sigma factor [Candidatus Limnocylindrales bacterium]
MTAQLADATPVADEDLMRQVAAGSQAAVGSLYDRYAGAIYGIAYQLCHDRGTAEDVVQETFLALWNRAETFDPAAGSLSGWLYAIARHRALDHLRWSRRRIPASPFSVVVGDRPDEAAAVDWLAAAGTVVGAATGEIGPEVLAERGETGAEVRSALDVLTPPEREAILLAYRDGLSQSEIAARLGWPLGTVKTRSRRALRRLREALTAGTGDACCGEGASA